MPTYTTNYNLAKPLVNSAVDQDLWGGELNADMDSIDGLLKAGIVTAVQSSQTTGFAVSASISIRYLYPCDATGGAFAATLPAAATAANGATVYIKKTDSSVNAVTATRSGADTIDGDTTYVITGENQVIGLVSDGVSKWYILDDGQISLSDATTTTKGIVELATTAETQAGSDTDRVITPAGLKGAINFSKAFTSSQTNITASSKVDIAHGLGAVPSLVQCSLVCTSADANYSVGDKILLDGHVSATLGVSIFIDSTNISLIFAGQLAVVNKTTFATPTIVFSKWQVIARAWA